MSELSQENAWLPRFEAHLARQGYKPTTIQRHLVACRGFLRDLQEQGIRIEEVSPSILDAYFKLQAKRYEQRHGHVPRDTSTALHLFDRGITELLRLVQGQWPPLPSPTGKLESFHQRLCDSYAEWLADTRGLSPNTIKMRRWHGQQFLAWLGECASADSLHELTVKDIDAYFQAKAPRYRRRTRAELVFCVRDFLKYLHNHGLIARDLAATVTSPTVYAMDSIPSALKPDDVDTVLNVAKQNRTPVGIRNYAIILLLAHYGLRAGEVVRLRLEDIDWHHDCFRVRQSKIGTEAVFPLLPPVGNALLDYLQHGRPKTTARQVFVRALAPHQPLSSIYNIVARLLTKANITSEGRRGPHTFRHARAVSLLRDAVPLTAVSAILGHRTSAHTRVYLKLATEDLRDVGLEVPDFGEVAP